MKIEQIESLLLGNGYVVRITTDTGLTGIGQTACWGYPTAVQSIVDVFKDYLIGQNPLRIEHHWQHLYRMAPLPRHGRHGGRLSRGYCPLGHQGQAL